jgi:hypothetical protein
MHCNIVMLLFRSDTSVRSATLFEQPRRSIRSPPHKLTHTVVEDSGPGRKIRSRVIWKNSCFVPGAYFVLFLQFNYSTAILLEPLVCYIFVCGLTALLSTAVHLDCTLRSYILQYLKVSSRIFVPYEPMSDAYRVTSYHPKNVSRMECQRLATSI